MKRIKKYFSRPNSAPVATDTESALASLTDLHNTFAAGNLQDQLLIPSTDNLHWYNRIFNKKTAVISISSFGAISVGLSMTPISNEEVKKLENYDIDVHLNSTTLALSTINTFLSVSFCAGAFLYYNLTHSDKKEITDRQKLLLNLSKVISVIPSLIQPALLWNIELHNREIEGTKGFDQFIAWATFTSLQLFIYKTLTNYHSCKNLILKDSEHVTLDSIGSKLFVYGISTLSVIGRGISFTNVIDDILKNMGIESDASIPLSIITGGIIGNTIIGIGEYLTLKKLFKTNTDNITYKHLMLGIACVLEGGWFSLPLISQGLSASEDWNSLLKGAVFSSYFLSHTSSEATHLYDSILPEVSQEEQHDEILLSGEFHHSEISE